ncbi:hypothetical protein PR202_ga27729 [Eleusine coracana subsp. coracana]|uniref:Uncharacterized protein n=1 Tax=Eleusine coracana subsp. coracana TaxID=191504 RepID=A0AAV5DFY9_ELECO|nr:hypothetical protein PR202_ga27729 [Eleusine coracana subsp. coracana]
MPPSSSLCCLRLIVLLLTLASHAVGLVIIPKWLDCPSSQAPSPAPPASTNDTSSSRFRYNVVRLLEALPSAAASNGGFASIGRGSGGDLAFCSVFYADTNASTAYEDAFRQQLYNINNVSDKVALGRTYYALMKSLSVRDVNATAESLSTAAMFATGHAVCSTLPPPTAPCTGWCSA